MSLRESRVDREQELLQGLTDVHLLQLDDDWKLGKPRSPTREQTEAMAREKERRGLDKPPGFSSVGFLEDEDYLVGAEEFFKERYGVLGKILSFAMSMGKNPLIMILVPGLFLFWLTGWFLYKVLARKVERSMLFWVPGLGIILFIGWFLYKNIARKRSQLDNSR